MSTSRRGRTGVINRFRTRLIATDRIHATFDEVWAVFGSTDRLASLTPLLVDIRPEGDQWHWRMVGVSGLGMTITPEFTTLMVIHETGMRFRPDPSRPEPAGATGEIRVEPHAPDRTDLMLDLTVFVDLPLPRLTRGAVGRIMDTTLRAGGRRFARTFLKEIGGVESDGLAIRSAPLATEQ